MTTKPTSPFEGSHPAGSTVGSVGAVSVLGLGAMGATLASTLLNAGFCTTVWNRTAARAEPLAALGAQQADSPEEAVQTSPLVIVCLLDHDAVQATLSVLGSVLAGRSIVNFTSTTPEDARSTAKWMGEAGANYLDGAIMVPTPLVGSDEALFLYSGARQVFDNHLPQLRALGGDAHFLGEDAGRAALHDLGLLDLYFAGMTGFMHAAAMLTADGVRAEDFLPFAMTMAEVLRQSLPDLARNIDAGAHLGDEDTLDMEQIAMAHVVEAAEARGVDPGLPELVRSIMARSIEAGHGRESFSRIIDQLRDAQVAWNDTR